MFPYSLDPNVIDLNDDRRRWGLVAAGVVVVVILALAVTAFLGIGLGHSCDCWHTVSFQFEYTPENDTLRITHTGGDDIPVATTEALFVETDDERWDPFDLPLTAGDTVTIHGVDPGSTVRIVHEHRPTYDDPVTEITEIWTRSCECDEGAMTYVLARTDLPDRRVTRIATHQCRK